MKVKSNVTSYSALRSFGRSCLSPSRTDRLIVCYEFNETEYEAVGIFQSQTDYSKSIGDKVGTGEGVLRGVHANMMKNIRWTQRDFSSLKLDRIAEEIKVEMKKIGSTSSIAQLMRIEGVVRKKYY